MSKLLLLQVGSLLMAAGLASAKSLPEGLETSSEQPPERKILIDDQSVESHRTQLHSAISNGVEHLVKLGQLLVGVRDKIFYAKQKAIGHLKAIKDELGESIKGIVLKRLDTGKDDADTGVPQEEDEKVVIVTVDPDENEIFSNDQTEKGVYLKY